MKSRHELCLIAERKIMAQPSNYGRGESEDEEEEDIDETVSVCNHDMTVASRLTTSRATRR